MPMRRHISALCLVVTALAVCLALTQPQAAFGQNAAFKRIENLEFRDSSVGEAIRLLNRLSGVNIFATREAAGREFSMVVQDTTVRGVISSIARVTGLSYSFDEEANSFMLMTNEQFAADVVITRNAELRVFTLRHQNVVTAAQVIESLFGDRVSLSIDTEDPDRLEISGDGFQRSRTLNADDRNLRLRSTSRGDAREGGEDTVSAAELSAERLQRLTGPSADDGILELGEVADAFGLEPAIFLTINREHNLLYVRTADRAAMRDIERVIQETDRPTKQVLLEMRIMSLDLDDEFRSAFNFGLNDGSVRTNTSATGTTTTGATGIEAGGAIQRSGGLFFQFINDNLLAQIDALETENRARTLSTPMLAASNNSPAQLFVGTETVLARGFSSQTSVGSTGQATTVSATDVELRDVGQTLDILPRINADGTVTLVIQQENSTIVQGGGNLPFVDQNGNVTNVSIDTVNTSRVGGTVTARSGTTIAIGGLIEDTDARGNRRAPILGNIPILGLAFRGDNSRKDRSELVLLITPHIYAAGPEGERLARERLARASRNADVDRVGFAASESGVPGVRLRGQQQQYVALTRYAASMRHGKDPGSFGPYRGIDPVPVESGAGLRLIDRSAVTAEPVESWRKNNLYVTAVVLTNTLDTPQAVDLRHLAGGWIAATAEAEKLAPNGEMASRAYVYLISDRPFEEVVGMIAAAGGL